MLYEFLYPYHVDFSFLNIFRYITFRTIYGGLTAFLICFLVGPFVIRKLTQMQIGQIIQTDGPQSHMGKQGTPTMGGILILFSVFMTTIIWGNLSNHYVNILLLTLLLFGFIGFVDDYLMQIKKRNMGFSAKGKFLIQVLFGLIIGWLIYKCPDFNSTLTIPFFKDISPDLGIWYIPFACLVIVATSNAVNLTDGLDGLAIGPYIVASVTYMFFAYVAGHLQIAEYLHLRHIASAGEIAVVCGTLAGAGLGFLWFNAHPAQIFMGDSGSIPLGGILGTIAIITKQEILLLIVGGLFVIEALSVIIQVSYFKLTKGKRIFRMAPLHHHFELKGWHESKVIVRFWIISITLALLSLSTLKIR
ncbi:MAG: phospho-N-acetylmuramoyl-pentapeptide-transferase [Desulfobacula sp.]|jgi:phospho-N-acetylmuramoyl-pentapeptide-transferase|uniref:phospho-N-acetylmuramoyl-pentapeptide- transferase n=1 Tax=Desulfobacula sp. TaxID=2593537 RepID=UPI001D335295|nr:phospho-N-acetylmuramoyl-pentapeptide-transferase [Desulfobacula sp.]MBT3483818.1 phospho-N-acetylmuramoyl-pentapeptide-transferase [Desulfobacula sp.]MBT3803006.1 phospho-N-acetylmuramoyl-pentapeptide-transferase [Desulfobacula sp.]MBT4023481.1 phospho-N-acetylmuramoyl-pentapeptide-transferase [Desulfobacula sp.]MBT4197054.1 phospho-N-acetylmuramoyl-pentapeptide-transferase [Desulfobacula sp.]